MSVLLVLLCLTGVGLGTLGFFEMRKGVGLRKTVTLLEGENSLLNRNLMALSSQIEGLRRDLVVLAQNDARVRSLAQLPVETEEPFGMGGPVPSAGLDVDALIASLQLELEARRQSQMEIQGLLTQQLSLERATPSGNPVETGAFSSAFGYRNAPFGGGRKLHEGLDISAPTGTPVRVTADGVVSRVGFDPGYGKLVVVEHGYGLSTLYAHNSRILVQTGDRVSRGDVITHVGNTGLSTGPHLHYEVKVKGRPRNPSAYL